RLDFAAALAAVTGPVKKTTDRRYADGVAEALVRDLLEVEVQTPKGVRKVTAQDVEPVQLQIVCQGLWRALPAGEKVITLEHLRAEAEARGFGAEVLLDKGALAEARHWLDSPAAAELVPSERLRTLVDKSQAAADEARRREEQELNYAKNLERVREQSAHNL